MATEEIARRVLILPVIALPAGLGEPDHGLRVGPWECCEHVPLHGSALGRSDADERELSAHVGRHVVGALRVTALVERRRQRTDGVGRPRG